MPSAAPPVSLPHPCNPVLLLQTQAYRNQMDSGFQCKTGLHRRSPGGYLFSGAPLQIAFLHRNTRLCPSRSSPVFLRSHPFSSLLHCLLAMKRDQVVAAVMLHQDFRAAQILCCFFKPVLISEAVTHREQSPSLIQLVRKALVICSRMCSHSSGVYSKEVNRCIRFRITVQIRQQRALIHWSRQRCKGQYHSLLSRFPSPVSQTAGSSADHRAG